MSSSAEASIRSLVSRYAQAVVQRDAAAWGSTWATGGIWELLGQAPTGRKAVLEHWNRLMSGIVFVYQLAGEGSVHVDQSGARGTGRFPTVEFTKLGDGPGTLLLGTYHDEYIVEEGEWRFAHRRMEIHYMGPSDMSGSPMPTGSS
ncbi:MAG: nuclear transport factor 2 family protein [Deltaproteobacteria bacterium]|nr:nuclear transport factor 2 family protein [Deltaproteobacteria bacterium]